MANATLSFGQIAVLVAARRLDPEFRSSIRNQVFTAAKAQFGIPDSHKLTVEVDNNLSANYGVLLRKQDRTPYVLGAGGRALAYPVAPAVPEKRWFRVDLNRITLEDAVNDMRDGVVEFTGGTPQAQLDDYPTVTSDDDYDFKVVDGDVYVSQEEADF